jgi:hypothetical protein
VGDLMITGLNGQPISIRDDFLIRSRAETDPSLRGEGGFPGDTGGGEDGGL